MAVYGSARTCRKPGKKGTGREGGSLIGETAQVLLAKRALLCIILPR